MYYPHILSMGRYDLYLISDYELIVTNLIRVMQSWMKLIRQKPINSRKCEREYLPIFLTILVKLWIEACKKKLLCEKGEKNWIAATKSFGIM